MREMERSSMVRIKIDDMDLEQIAGSGQCFRMEKQDPMGVWSIHTASNYVEAVREEDSFLFSCEEKEFQTIWAPYFDVHTDYGRYKEQIEAEDSYLKTAVKWGWGVRILRQDLWEMLVTFLISQNNNIPRIKGSVKELCKQFGEEKSGVGLVRSSNSIWTETKRVYHTFPTPKSIALAGLSGLSGLSLGYRDKYILSMAERCRCDQGAVWLLMLRNSDYEEAHAMLMKEYGIGKKVADCICLFGLHHVGAFPVDTHVKQILNRYYPKGFPLKRYEGYAGILQQYMFYYKINQ